MVRFLVPTQARLSIGGRLRLRRLLRQAHELGGSERVRRGWRGGHTQVSDVIRALEIKSTVLPHTRSTKRGESTVRPIVGFWRLGAPRRRGAHVWRCWRRCCCRSHCWSRRGSSGFPATGPGIEVPRNALGAQRQRTLLPRHVGSRWIATASRAFWQWQLPTTTRIRNPRSDLTHRDAATEPVGGQERVTELLMETNLSPFSDRLLQRYSECSALDLRSLQVHDTMLFGSALYTARTERGLTG